MNAKQRRKARSADKSAVAQAKDTTWSYSRPGIYTWEFMVVVNGVWCRRSGTISVVSGAGCGLNCAASVPATAQVGQVVTFRGYASWTRCTTAPSFLWRSGVAMVPEGTRAQRPVGLV